MDDDRRVALRTAKLRAVVRDHLGLDDPTVAEAELGAFPGGATLRIGRRAFVYAADSAERALGPALAWAGQRDVDDLALVADEGAGVLARRAAMFSAAPQVWEVDGRSLRPARPAPHLAPVEPPASARRFTGLLQEAGASVLVEHGAVIGEVRGLEVARVVVEESGARVDVGVGRHDREAFALIHGEVPLADALASVVDVARGHRRPGAEPHPLNRLAQERWLRDRLVREPGLVGAVELQPVEPALPRDNVKDPVPAPAIGRDARSRPVLAVCSVGVDLDLVPAAADVRAREQPDARLVLVVPERDDLPVTRTLAAALREPAEVLGLPGDWRT